MEAHWFEREDHFAGFIHRFDRFLKPRRGGPDTELPIVSDADCYGYAVSNPCVPNARDVGGCLRSYRVEADHSGFTRDAGIAYVDVVAASSYLLARSASLRDVLVARVREVQPETAAGLVAARA